MCCDVCPRYTNCEEEDHLNELCCTSCPEYVSCYKDDAAKDSEFDKTRDDLGEA